MIRRNVADFDVISGRRLKSNMQFQVLSHAALLIRTDTTSIVVDPWLLGSCYWRSWWNFPRAVFNEKQLADVDAVVISHVHWDHWHGPTLKKFFPQTAIYVPNEPGLRSSEDLVAAGFKDVTKVPHGRSIEIGDIKITLYQFGLFLNDACVIIEADGVTLMDVNDAKVAGLALDGILARHPTIDFAFRSHSSANGRVCFRIEDDPHQEVDDREHYFRSFGAFMDRVKPRYAIPFASNHCHLHEEVFHFNDYICNPLEMGEYFDTLGGDRPWRLQVMLPGSSWSSDGSFDLRDDGSFSNLRQTLADYRDAVSPTLDRTRELENKVQVNDAVLKQLGRMLSYAPLWTKAKGHSRITAFWPDGRETAWLFDRKDGSYQVVPASVTAPKGEPTIRMPALVLRDAVVRNMFHHAVISKRCKFIAKDAEDMQLLGSALASLERFELGLYPVNLGYCKRLARSYWSRWRELVVYFQAAWLLKVRKRPGYLVEEDILRSGT